MKRGYITIFFALIFVLLASFILSIFEGIKINARRLKAECAFSIAENSVLGEYQKELLETYDLFYVDTAYKTGLPDYHQIEAHLWRYLEKNYGDTPASVEICQITMATDNQGTPYRKQISDYMKDKIGISYVEQLTSLFNEVSKEGFLEEDKDIESAVDTSWQETLAQMEAIPEDTWKSIERYCPIKEVKNVRNSFVLSQVIENEATLSKKEVDITDCVSGRTRITGTGTDEKQTLLDKIYFIAYVFEKFTYFSQDETDNSLDYQIEYLIGGKGSDYENLSIVAKQLLLLRESINLAYLFTDEEKMSLIEEISAALAALVMCPEIEPIISILFVGLWSYAESVMDVKLLLAGEKVPLFKSKESWNTDLDSGFDVTFSSNESAKTEDGMDYKQYIELLLLFSNNEKITYRSMDLIEMHIRETEGNENFRMDGCAEDFLVNIVFDISGFGSYQIVRKFGYFS